MGARMITDSAGKAWRAAAVDLQTPDVMQAARIMAVREPDMDKLVQDLLRDSAHTRSS